MQLSKADTQREINILNQNQREKALRKSPIVWNRLMAIKEHQGQYQFALLKNSD